MVNLLTTENSASSPLPTSSRRSLTMDRRADGNFSEQQFRDSVNAGLANTLGNMVNRTLGLLSKNLGCALPVGAADVPLDHPLREVAAEKVAEAAALYEGLLPHRALEALIAAATRGNTFMEESAPWVAYKKVSEWGEGR